MARLELELDGSRLKAGAEQAETSLEGVKRAADRAEKSTDRLGAEGAKDMQRLAAETRKTTAAQTALAQSTQRMGTRFSSARGQIQNVSFQIGDFATQVGAGTAASVALGQQLPQLLGGFGALGAVLGAVVAIGVPLSAALLNSAGSAKTLSDALDDLDASTGDAIQSAKALGVEWDALKSSLGNVSSLVDAVSALRDLEEVVGSVVDLSQVSGGAEGFAQLFLGLGGGADAVSRLTNELKISDAAADELATSIALLEAAKGPEQISEEIDNLVRGLIRAEGGVEDLSSEALNFIAQLVDAQQNADALAAILERYEPALQGAVERARDFNKVVLATSGVGSGRGAGPGGPLVGSVDAQLLAQGISPSAEDPPSATSGGSAGGAAVAKIDQTAQAYERLRSSLDPAYAAQVKYNSAVEILDKNLAEGNITLETHNEVLRLARERYEQAAQASGKLQKFAEELEELQDTEGNIVKAGQALQQTLSDFLFNPFETGVRGMVLQFSDALRRMASDAIAAQITQSIFGALGGFGGGGGSPFPLYDSGGYIPSGQAGMVAEKRPEVVNGSAVDMPSIVRGPARVQGGASTARNANAAPVANIKNVIALNTSDLAAAVVNDPQFEARVTELRVRDAS